MNSLIKTAAAVSTAALMAVAMTSLPAAAQKYDDSNNCVAGQENCRPDEGNMKRPRFDQDNQKPEVQRQAQSDWKYDSSRHERRRHKDDKFRFFFGGFWYPAPYWSGSYGYAIPGRISCGEGRHVVDRRFNRVRTVECRGTSYTYLGRRGGDTFRILVSARSGRIISVRPI